jgi:hypothetical protein
VAYFRIRFLRGLRRNTKNLMSGLPVFVARLEPGLSEFEAGLLTRERHRLRIFENKESRRIFGCKRYELAGEWRKSRKNSFGSITNISNFCVISSQHTHVYTRCSSIYQPTPLISRMYILQYVFCPTTIP